MVIVARLGHAKNVPDWIRVRLLGKVTLAKSLQLAKALAPRLITLFGMITLVRPVQP